MTTKRGSGVNGNGSLIFVKARIGSSTRMVGQRASIVTMAIFQAGGSPCAPAGGVNQNSSPDTRRIFVSPSISGSRLSSRLARSGDFSQASAFS